VGAPEALTRCNRPRKTHAPSVDRRTVKRGGWRPIIGGQKEYREFFQPAHYKKNVLSCADCHSPHAVAGKAVTDPKASCDGCHGTKYNVAKIMPGTGSTAANLFVATHTFNANQARKETPRATSAPEYFYSR
jgi:5-methylcytosine-specific restriction endonuclease McrA